MRLSLLSLLGLMTAAGGSPLAAQPSDQSRAAPRPSHPEEVALVDEGQQGSVYRRFPGGQRLYTYARDTRTRASCNKGCEGAWPPVPAPADARPVGRWSIVQRYDGSRQWALDGKPVYTRFHDSPEAPRGHGFKGLWRIVPYETTRAVVPSAENRK